MVAAWTAAWANLAWFHRIEIYMLTWISVHVRGRRNCERRLHKGQYVYLVKILLQRPEHVGQLFHVHGTDLSEKRLAKFLKLNSRGADMDPGQHIKRTALQRSDPEPIDGTDAASRTSGH